jgi:hypothetical protein
MIRMPRTVIIRSHTWRIVAKPQSVMYLDGEALDGWCKHQLEEIWITQGLKLWPKQHTLFHELGHAAGQPHIKDGMTEEELITALSPGLLQVLQDNPPLVAFLTQKQGTA